MFSRFLSPACLAAALGVTLLTGCINLDFSFPVPFEHKEDFLVMPDGSGKITIIVDVLYGNPTTTTKEKTAADWAARPNRSRYPPQFVLDSFHGAAAFSEMHEEATAPACIRQSFAVYFDDLNRFQFAGPSLGLYFTFGAFGAPDQWQQGLDLKSPGELAWLGIMGRFMWTAFRFHKLEEGFLLDVSDSQVPLSATTGVWDELAPSAIFFRYPAAFWAAFGEEWAKGTLASWKAVADAPLEGPDPDGSRQATKEFAQKVVEGGSFSQSWTLPGQIKRAEGWTSSEGRTATFVLRLRNLEGLKDAEAKAKLDKQRVRTILCGPSSLPEQEVAAFRQELEQAEAAWNEWQREEDEKRKRAATQAKQRQAKAGAIRTAKQAKQREAETAQRRPLGLLQSARNLLDGGKLDVAKEYLQRIDAEHPDSNVAPAAREVLDLLKKRKVEEAKRRLQEIIDEHLKAP